MNFCFFIQDDMLERNCDHVTLHDVDPTALRQLIDYTYSGEITITEDNVQVNKLAEYFYCLLLKKLFLFATQ